MSSIERLLVATRKGLFTVERATGKWDVVEVAFEGDDITCVLADARDGALYAGVQRRRSHNHLFRSDDGGRTFTEVGVPQHTDSALTVVWSLESGGAERPERLWAGTIPGGLFRSDDRGATWSLVHSLWDHAERQRWLAAGLPGPGIHSIAVDPRDSDHVLVAIAAGGVWRTRDAGASFHPASPGPDAANAHGLELLDVHRLVSCRANPDVVWLQHRAGIFRSEDAAETFTPLTSATPSPYGFSVAAHPHDSMTAWFVPTVSNERRMPVNRRLCVMQTRDGGRTFEPKSHGLPERFAYDLVYRHALDVDNSGTLLGLGSTTGNLWLSEDGGESFACVSHHLPPINALRFATARVRSRSFEGRASVAPPPRVA